MLSLMENDSCHHQVLLEAMCLNALLMNAHTTKGLISQNELLILAIAFIRALGVTCDMDVNAVLTHHLNQSKRQAGTKARPAQKL